jgi:hypothetical protein
MKQCKKIQTYINLSSEINKTKNKKYHIKALDEISKRNKKRGEDIMKMQETVSKEFHKIRRDILP